MFQNRRSLLKAIAASTFTALAACRPPAPEGDGNPGSPRPGPTAMTVFKDPSCGCCSAWAAIARQAGYEVTEQDRSDMAQVKARLGVPDELASCHTALVGGYVIEGHVPMADIQRLLRQRPAALRGLAVPGMPRGSPGMEMPDGSADPFEVVAFDRAGKSRPYRS